MNRYVEPPMRYRNELAFHWLEKPRENNTSNYLIAAWDPAIQKWVIGKTELSIEEVTQKGYLWCSKISLPSRVESYDE